MNGNERFQMALDEYTQVVMAYMEAKAEVQRLAEEMARLRSLVDERAVER